MKIKKKTLIIYPSIKLIAMTPIEKDLIEEILNDLRKYWGEPTTTRTTTQIKKKL